MLDHPFASELATQMEEGPRDLWRRLLSTLHGGGDEAFELPFKLADAVAYSSRCICSRELVHSWRLISATNAQSHSMPRLAICCCVLLSASAADPIRADNWPQFRGPGGLGVSDQTGVPLKWSSGENIAWQADLPGPGSSSPIVVRDRVYIT